MSIRMHILGSMLRAWARLAPTERGAFHLVRAARRLMPPHEWRGRFRTPQGIELQLDLSTYPDCCMAFGLYELDTYRLLRRIVAPGSTFVDCGANLGYFTLAAARWVGPDGRVEAFEPDPANRARLEENLARNNLAANVRVHSLAASDRGGEIDFFHPEGDEYNHGMAGAYAASAAPAGARMVVRCARLDEALDRSPDVVKIDIEGGELAALRGMSRWLESAPPKLVVESSPLSARLAGHEPADLFRTIRAIQPRYRIFWIGARLRELHDASELAAITRQGNLFATVDA
jgi:FkbM family methyltransferase